MSSSWDGMWWCWDGGLWQCVAAGPSKLASVALRATAVAAGPSKLIQALLQVSSKKVDDIVCRGG
jgi:hypothetical protein